MSLIEDKNKIFGKIAALKTLSGGLPKINIKSLFSNNGTNPILYLLNLFQVSIGSDNIKKLAPEFIVSKSFDLESKITNNLINELASIYTCGNIIEFTDNQKTNGVDIPLNEIDLFSKTYYSPNSTYGQILYSNGGVDTLIYSTIQANGDVITTDLFEFRYNIINDTINVKPIVNTLNDFNSNYLSDIKFFNPKLIYFSLFDYSFNLLRKSKSRLKKEEEINRLLDNIIKSETTNIDDSFFQFSQEDVVNINEEIDNKFDSVIKLKTCNEISVFINESLLEESFNSITNNVNIVDFENNINNQYDSITESISPNDKSTSILEMVINTLNNLPIILLRLIIRPDVMLLFALNNHVLGDTDNKGLLRKMISVIARVFGSVLLTYLVMFLLKKFLSILTPLLINKKIVDTKERLNNKKKQYQSLFGINNNLLKIGKKLNSLSLPDINNLSQDIDNFSILNNNDNT